MVALKICNRYTLKLYQGAVEENGTITYPASVYFELDRYRAARLIESIARQLGKRANDTDQDLVVWLSLLGELTKESDDETEETD